MAANGRIQDRVIVHIDMNAFYCSCHAAENPKMYQGKPTAVAGNPHTRHGILVTASYEARALGVRATMTVSEALRYCKQLILISPDFTLYRSYSNRVFSIVRDFTPIIEIFSIDECFADMTGSSQFGTPFEIAQKIQNRILTELSLPCSVGIGPNRFLAKMASDLKKPLGITEIGIGNLSTLLWPLPIEDMFGVGKQTAVRLQNVGIQTIEDLARYDEIKLVRMFGTRGRMLFNRANGLDETTVDSDHNDAKSIGHSITLAQDTSNKNSISTTLLNLADQVGRRVRQHGMAGRSISVTIRFQNMKTITRTQTLKTGTNLTEEIFEYAKTLVFKAIHSGQSVRLLGITLGQFEKPKQSSIEQPVQTTLFEHLETFDNTDSKQKQQRLHKLTEVTDRLRNRYGEDIVIRGSMMGTHESNQIRDKKNRGTSLQKDNLNNHEWK